MYIVAGKLRLEELRATELPRLRQKANTSNLPEDAQAASDYANMLGRFEKRLYDLELTRTISIQMAPQIRMIQNNDSLMAEKIQTATVNTIPLWKSQMVLAMSMYHSQQAMEASHDVSEVTNQLLKKNAQDLHMISSSALCDRASASENFIRMPLDNAAIFLSGSSSKHSILRRNLSLSQPE